MIWGPRHLERLATTSARRARSAKSTLGCALICCQALFVGIKLDDVGSGSSISTGFVDVGQPEQLDSFLQAMTDESTWVWDGQQSQVTRLALELLMAVQNALPKSSSAQAAQLAGSPVHVASALRSGWGGNVVTGKIEFT